MDTRVFHEIVSAGLIDTIITSPPYWNLKNYGGKNQVGYGQSKVEYMADIEKLLNNWYDMIKSTGSLWLIADNYRKNGEVHLLPWEIANSATRVGWKVRDFIIWDKQYNVPWQQKGQLRNTSEFIVFMTKTDNYKYYTGRIKELDEISKWWVDFPERFNPKGKTPTNIWSFPIRRRGTWPKPSKVDHYCSLPGPLVGRIIELTTDPGDVVSDPFAGSGVVLAQAQVMGRSYVGCELNPAYVKMFEETKLEVANEWNQLSQRRNKYESAKIDFEKTVMALRALKYSRQIAKNFLDLLGDDPNEVEALISWANLPKELNRMSPIKLNLIFVVLSAPTKYKSTLSNLISRSNKAPLSHYGIESDISVMTYERLLNSKTTKSNDKLYLYPVMHTRKYTSVKKLASWFLEDGLGALSDKNKNIPILSNLGIDIEWALG